MTIDDIVFLRDFRQIDNKYPYIMEELYAEFDNAFPLLRATNSSFCIYGGFLRDVIAGIKPKGDLDVIPHSSVLCKNIFAENPKWVHNSAKNIKKSSFKNVLNPISTTYPIKFNNTEFINNDGKIVHIVRSAKNIDFETFLRNSILNIDIICCGFVMDNFGNVFEVLEGAEQDCIDKVLRFNPKCNEDCTNSLAKRVEKLVERGWTSKININKIIKQNKKKNKLSAPVALKPLKINNSNKVYKRKVVVLPAGIEYELREMGIDVPSNRYFFLDTLVITTEALLKSPKIPIFKIICEGSMIARLNIEESEHLLSKVAQMIPPDNFLLNYKIFIHTIESAKKLLDIKDIKYTTNQDYKVYKKNVASGIDFSEVDNMIKGPTVQEFYNNNADAIDIATKPKKKKIKISNTYANYEIDI